MREWASAILLLAPAFPVQAQLDCAPDIGTLGISSRLTLFASIPNDTLEPAVYRQLRGTVLQEYVARFTRPSDMSLVQSKAEMMIGNAHGAYDPAMPPLAAVRFTVARGGIVLDIAQPELTGDPQFDSALVEPATRLMLEHTEFLLPPGRDTLQMRVNIGINPSAGLYPMPLAGLRPLGTITSPAHIIKTNLYPTWPKDLEARRVNDDVVVRILVDEHGRAVMDSVKVVRGTQKGYIDAVLAVLPKYRWTPARSGDCPVKQWVEMPFMFHFE